MRRLWPWVLIPGLAFWGLEVYARTAVRGVPSWYRSAARLAAQEPIDTIFIGSSRVHAAIVPRAFDEAVAAGGATRGRGLNLGRGFSTDAQHYLGLRRLLAARPRGGEGLVVLAEAPGALPRATRWEEERWAIEEAPELLAEVLTIRDLPSFWRSTGLGLEMRAKMTQWTFLWPFTSFNRRVRVRRHLAHALVPSLARNWQPDTIPERLLGSDLEGPGPASSIRTDPATVAAARKLALFYARYFLEHQTPVGDWSGTIPEDIVRLVQSHGGRFVFFEMPESEVFLKTYRTPMRVADRAAFAEQVRRWDACLVHPRFPTTNEDFPDLWHLRPDRAPAYSAAVARAWLDGCPQR